MTTGTGEELTARPFSVALRPNEAQVLAFVPPGSLRTIKTDDNAAPVAQLLLAALLGGAAVSFTPTQPDAAPDLVHEGSKVLLLVHQHGGQFFPIGSAALDLLV